MSTYGEVGKIEECVYRIARMVEPLYWMTENSLERHRLDFEKIRKELEEIEAIIKYDIHQSQG